MPQTTTAYQNLLRQAQQLPLRARRQLAETLLAPPNADEQFILVSMSRFRRDAQARFQRLMEHNNDGQLAPAERKELEALVTRYETLLLLNTEALLKANCPELFTATGRLKRKRLQAAVRQKTRTSQRAATK